ncbi:MAG TPA: FAD-dependent oxidoreductase, partial [Kiloniellales bacterium]|nr:FAD-dependent oxidoreductase [Kiloniellales bacterium]
RVTIVEMANLLPRDDPELVALLRARLQDEGIAIREGAKVVAVEPKGEGVAVSIEDPTGKDRVEGSALLLAAGRQPTLDGLGLEAAGITHDRRGVTVDARLRSSNKRVFAAGDVAGGPQFTHMASYHAGIVIRNLLFRLPAKVDTRALPWVTYTDPELAQVGLTEAEARARHGEVRVLRAPFAENDRARTERTTDGLVKLVATKRGKVLGASILGPHAGELIQPWVLAIARNLKLSAVAQMIAPYPTLGEANKRAAGDFYSETLFGSRTRWLVRQLLRLP